MTRMHHIKATINVESLDFWLLQHNKSFIFYILLEFFLFLLDVAQQLADFNIRLLRYFFLQQFLTDKLKILNEFLIFMFEIFDHFE